MKKSLLILTLLYSAGMNAASLSNLSLFKRCYGQLTGTRPVETDALTQQVINGQITPIAACQSVLSRAILTGGGGTTIANTSDGIAKNVLKTMHNVHNSWFTAKDVTLSTNEGQQTLSMRDIWDMSTPALYFTRALFQQNPNFTSVVLGSEYLGPVRDNMDPAYGAAMSSPYEKFGKDQYCMTGTWQFAPTGNLLGVRVLPPTNTSCAPNAYNDNKTVQFPLYENVGGGVLGNSVFLMTSLKIAPGFQADGTTHMPRRWARNIFSDLMCRNLPVIRQADASPFVVGSSSVPFRQSASCVLCHASMDRLSSTIRGVTMNVSGGQRPAAGPLFSHFVTPTLPAETEWPTAADSNYSLRPASGTLFFRNYQGNLIDLPVKSVEEVGTKLSQQDDLYICAARRYFEYFTGMQVQTGDLGDPSTPPLSDADMKNRTTVIGLGLSLKSHKNLRTLINDIMNLPLYKDSAYGM